jgi:hypothetical protein
MANKAKEEAPEPTDPGQSETEPSLGKAAAMTGALAAGVVLGPALLPAVAAVGLGMLLAPKILPVASQTVNPVLKTAVRTGHKAARTAKDLFDGATGKIQELVGPKVQDIVDWAYTDEPAEPGPTTARRARQPRKT